MEEDCVIAVTLPPEEDGWRDTPLQREGSVTDVTLVTSCRVYSDGSVTDAIPKGGTNEPEFQGVPRKLIRSLPSLSLQLVVAIIGDLEEVGEPSLLLKGVLTSTLTKPRGIHESSDGSFAVYGFRESFS